MEIVYDRCPGTRLFRTSTGHIGTGLNGIRVGDVVCVLYGGKVPYVLRQVGRARDNRYRFIGDAYVHGLMEGQGLHLRPERNFTLI